MKRVIFLAFILPYFVFAGTYTQGNGGHVLICPQGATGAHFSGGRTLLDLEEGSRLYGYTYESLKALRSRSFENAFASLLEWFPASAMTVPVDYYKDWFEERDREMSFYPVLKLWPGSSSQAKIPSSCHVEQGAIQYMSAEGYDPAMTDVRISMKFWTDSETALSNDLKAALVFHEYTFRFMRVARPLCADILARWMTSFMLSDQAQKMSAKDRALEIQRFPCRDLGDSHGY